MKFFDPTAETEKIVEFLKTEVGNRHAIIGISGGIDSSLVLKLASISLPGDRIHAFFLPEKRTPDADRKDVEELSVSTGIPYETIIIDPIVDSYRRATGNEDIRAIGNLKARIRMSLLYFYSNIYGGLVLGTTNRSEYMTGYFTKHGDGACDIEPIIHLYKTQEREIANRLGLPERIISKPPSAGLWSDQTDEEELGITYADLDSILQGIEEGNPVGKDNSVQIVRNLILQSEHKRIPPASIEIERK